MALLRSPLRGSHFDVGGVVAAPHWAAVFHDPVQAVEDALAGSQVLETMQEQKERKTQKTEQKSRLKSEQRH